MRIGSLLTVFMSNGSGLVLLCENGSGVLLSTSGAGLPNRTRAGLCFASLHHITPCAAPFTGISLNRQTAHIFPQRGERLRKLLFIFDKYYFISVSFSITVVSFISFKFVQLF